ncbi:hypothetical protein FOWG_18056 [Fusarium oxysporum f. sp. lycopersici MN25]|nr:hypothetical protein FOWG_18056 [Fusarium oxysporum f. sp. lycopersici MN25]
MSGKYWEESVIAIKGEVGSVVLVKFVGSNLACRRGVPEGC